MRAFWEEPAMYQKILVPIEYFASDMRGWRQSATRKLPIILHGEGFMGA